MGGSVIERGRAAAYGAMLRASYALAARHRKRSLFVMFTDVIDVRASNALIAHATRGAARHLPLVVALRNDALVAAATPAGVPGGPPPITTLAPNALATVTDPSHAAPHDGTEPARAAPRLTTDALYERAAAEELLSARDAALRAMRQAGVSVVDVSPTAMTAAVVNRYLELKGRGAV